MDAWLASTSSCRLSGYLAASRILEAHPTTAACSSWTFMRVSPTGVRCVDHSTVEACPTSPRTPEASPPAVPGRPGGDPYRPRSGARLATRKSGPIARTEYLIWMPKKDRRPQPTGETWFVYLLRCADGSLCTGVTKDVSRRCQQHNAGTASRYTRSRLPVELVYKERRTSRSLALKREAAIKAMSRLEKLALIRLRARTDAALQGSFAMTTRNKAESRST
jgi:predicted GIY-YIG superfamily endonuclease